jgi:hypothetical protein
VLIVSILAVAALVLAILVVVEGFTEPGQECDCPHLLVAVRSINWAPGLELKREESSSSGSPYSILLLWEAGSEGSEPPFTRITSALTTAGFRILEKPLLVRGFLPELEIWVGRNDAGVELPPRVYVRVKVREDSPVLADLLEPLRVALEH